MVVHEQSAADPNRPIDVLLQQGTLTDGSRPVSLKPTPKPPGTIVPVFHGSMMVLLISSGVGERTPEATVEWR